MPQQAVLAQPLGHVDGPGTYSCCVVGESRYQAALEWICGGKTPHGANHYIIAVIMPENGNQHDSNAVRIEIQGQVVGYLDRETAYTYRQRLRESGLPECALTVNAYINGGWNRGNGDIGMFGVRLDLPVQD